MAEPEMNPSKIGARVRANRERAGLGQEDLCDEIGRRGKPLVKRPSVAKLSRIETGVQPVPIDILPTLSEIVGIPPDELRPDLAKIFSQRPRARRRARAA